MSDRLPLPVGYVFVWLRAVQVARNHGYAIGLHGSMNRDLDMIAVPWTEEASPAEDLVEAIRVDLSGELLREPNGAITVEKPHGRRAWGIRLPHSHAYVDLSVMPLKSEVK